MLLKANHLTRPRAREVPLGNLWRGGKRCRLPFSSPRSSRANESALHYLCHVLAEAKENSSGQRGDWTRPNLERPAHPSAGRRWRERSSFRSLRGSFYDLEKPSGPPEAWGHWRRRRRRHRAATCGCRQHSRSSAKQDHARLCSTRRRAEAAGPLSSGGACPLARRPNNAFVNAPVPTESRFCWSLFSRH